MRRFVTVGLRELTPEAGAPPRYGLYARDGLGHPPYVLLVPPLRPRHPLDPVHVDEHLAVDTDLCPDPPAWECADVLYGSSPRAYADALRWLATTGSAGPGCGLLAVPLTAGGHWLVTGGAARTAAAVVVPCAVRPEVSLLPSCLHAWLVAGGSLSALSRDRCPPR
ncbi:hypothetical protein [Streptomyces sp. NPDC020965]|uniref:hypothetical protein n=1 Tax=Streptomyces sp. NPDC020965 TaxID=3365105 RepID=UPI0037A771C0